MRRGRHGKAGLVAEGRRLGLSRPGEARQGHGRLGLAAPRSAEAGNGEVGIDGTRRGQTGDPRSGRTRRGKAGTEGTTSAGLSRPGEARQGTAGAARRDMDRRRLGPADHGTDWRGGARRGKAGTTWPGKARPGVARHDPASLDETWLRLGKAGAARRGETQARSGLGRRGLARVVWRKRKAFNLNK